MAQPDLSGISASDIDRALSTAPQPAAAPPVSGPPMPAAAPVVAPSAPPDVSHIAAAGISAADIDKALGAAPPAPALAQASPLAQAAPAPAPSPGPASPGVDRLPGGGISPAGFQQLSTMQGTPLPAPAPSVPESKPLNPASPSAEETPMVPRATPFTRVDDVINQYKRKVQTGGEITSDDTDAVKTQLRQFLHDAGPQYLATGDGKQYLGKLLDSGWLTPQDIDAAQRGDSFLQNGVHPAGIAGDLDTDVRSIEHLPDMLLNLTGNDPRQWMQPTEAQGDALAAASQKQAVLDNVPGTVKDIAAGVPLSQIGRNYISEAENHPLLFAQNVASVAAPLLHGAGGLLDTDPAGVGSLDMNPTPEQIPEQAQGLHPTAPGENGAARAVDGKFVPATEAAPVAGSPALPTPKPSPRRMPDMTLPGARPAVTVPKNVSKSEAGIDTSGGNVAAIDTSGNDTKPVQSITAPPQATESIAAPPRVPVEKEFAAQAGAAFTPRPDDATPTAKSEAVSPKTGMTKPQESFLSGALTSYVQAGTEAPHAIDVPGDGRYTVAGARQANQLHLNLTGKPVSLPDPNTGEPFGIFPDMKPSPVIGSETGTSRVTPPALNPSGLPVLRGEGVPDMTVPVAKKAGVLAKYATDEPFPESSSGAAAPSEAPPGKTGPRLDPDAISAFGLGAISPVVEQMQDALAARVGGAVDAAREFGGDALAKKVGGRYRAAYSFSPEVGNQLNKTAASGEAAQTYATMQDRYIHQGLTAAQRELLGRYYTDQRAQAMEAQGNTSHNVPMLTPAERQQVANDPAMQGAIQRYEQDAGQTIHALRKFVSPRLKDAATPNGHFASLVTQDSVAPSGRGGGGSLASQQRLKGTKFANQATGGAKAGYVTDLGTVLKQTVPEVVQKANQRQLYKTILAQRDSAGNPLGFTSAGAKPLPDKITWEGKEYPATRIEVGTRAIPGPKLANGQTGSPRLLRVEMAVPAPLAADIADVTANVPRIGSGLDTVNKLGSVATAISLTSPAEVLYHANRVLGLAKSVPGMTSGIPALGRLQTLGKLINLDMSSPENVAALQRVMEANGGSSRPFAHAGGDANAFSRFNHGTLFGLPEGKGLGQVAKGNLGLDLRIRVAAENIRQKLEGNADPRRVREFANQFGQYTSKPDPLVEAARKVHPFAASSLPMRVTEVRRLVGDAGFKNLPPAVGAKIRAQSLAAGTGGTALGFVALNHVLSGHWPWQNAPGHEMDMDTGHNDTDGQRVYVSGSVIAPWIKRPLDAAGVPETLENLRQHAPPVKQADHAAVAAGRGLANAGMEELNSPLAGAVLAATTGKAPYITRGGSLYQVAPRAANGQSQALLNLGAAAGGLVPFGRASGAVSQPSQFHSAGLRALAALNLVKKSAAKTTGAVSGGSPFGGGSGGGFGPPRP